MKRRLLTLALVAGSATIGFLPLPASAESSSLTAKTDGWYQPDPSCGQGSGCVLANVPADVSGMLVTNPYPAGTLHVGFASGNETARSVLAFPLDTLTGSITGATLDVPLDVDPANGDLQSATAKVQVCLVTGDIVPAAGSVATPPATSCDTHATMKYVATPAPHLSADLAPILLGLPTTSGIALLPEAEEEDTAAWHVTFSAHDRADSTVTAPKLTVTTAAADEVAEEPLLPPVAEAPSTPVDGGFAALPDTGTGFTQGPAVDVPVDMAPAVSSPELSAPVASGGTVPTAQTITVGYQYPVVWLLPLAFLVLVPLASRALTRELAPVVAR